LIAASGMAASSIAAAQEPVRLSAKADAATYRIGDWIDVHITCTVESVVDSIAPVVRDSIGSFELIKLERIDKEPSWLLRLSKTDSGRAYLPPVPFRYFVKNDTTPKTAYTNPIFLTLTGMAFDPKGDIKDIKRPLSAPWLFIDYLPFIIAILLLAGAGAGYFVYRKKKKQKADALSTVKITVPPHREALTALRLLEEKKLWQQGLVKQYYSETTEIVRLFFEKRWSIVALEMTSDEILVQMKQIPEALTVWRDMETFFLIADLVKFAKYQPVPSDHEKEMQLAYGIVRAMIPKDENAAPPATAEKTKEAADHVR